MKGCLAVMQKISTVLIDGYLDEPSCLGVPPYISPHIRYLYGALVDGGIRREDIDYYTADGLRDKFNISGRREYNDGRERSDKKKRSPNAKSGGKRERENNRNKKNERNLKDRRDKQGKTCEFKMLEKYDLILVMAGTTVPGNYLRGRPLSLAEICTLGRNLTYPTLVLCGPITLVLESLPHSGEIKENYDIISGELGAADIYLRLCRREGARGSIDPGKLERAIKSGGGEIAAEALANWAPPGAELFSRHPHHPRLVAEMETFRGCPRSSHCHFCSEQLKKISYQRRPEHIAAEVEAIAAEGVHNYRLGCHTDILGYTGGISSGSAGTRAPGIGISSDKSDFARNDGSKLSGSGGNEGHEGHEVVSSDEDAPEREDPKSKLNVEALKKLYLGIHEADPDLNVLHLDNLNPAPLVRNPDAGRRALEIITRFNTAGDVAAFGLESADPRVLAANNIDTDKELTYRAVELVNEIGGRREEGVPKLLPGINFLFGLKGERPETYDYNFEFLQKIRDNGLLLRRINVRQVNPLGRYPKQEVERGSFEEFKEKVNREINQPLLRGVFPRGTVLSGLWPEKKEGRLTYGRQPGSYPILAGIPGDHLDKREMSVQVIDHGYRSLTALPYPFYVDKASVIELEQIPGIGKSRAGHIVAEEPSSRDELRKILGPSFPWNEWKDILKFSPEQ